MDDVDDVDDLDVLKGGEMGFDPRDREVALFVVVAMAVDRRRIERLVCVGFLDAPAFIVVVAAAAAEVEVIPEVPVKVVVVAEEGELRAKGEFEECPMAARGTPRRALESRDLRGVVELTSVVVVVVVLPP